MSADRGPAFGRAYDAIRRARGITTLVLERFDKTSANRFGPLLTVDKWWKPVTDDKLVVGLKIIEQGAVTAEVLKKTKAVTIDEQRYYVRQAPAPVGATKRWHLEVSPNENEL